MKDRKCKKIYSELIISILEEDNKFVRKFAEKFNLSPSFIQELRIIIKLRIATNSIIRT
jgi:hypothetical protein